MNSSSSRGWTYTGLIVAMLGIPAIVTAARWLGPVPPSNAAIAARELAILALTGLLLWLVVAGEKRPLSSIGLRFGRPGRSLAWGIGFAIVALAVAVGCLAIYSALGIHYGEGQRIAPSLAATSLAVFRAGISEEVFYRGFALERLESLTGSKWIAAAVTLIAFAGFHYRQGLPGVVLAFVLGALLTGFYLWKRDLVASITGHFLVDFIPNVALPLIAGSNA
jgi:membrane protease YdiL (CAAX protease family)